MIHLFVFVVPDPPASPFLNRAFIDLDNAFTLFGVILYAIFSFYLLVAVIVGVFKFGLRIPFLFAIHPIKYSKKKVISSSISIYFQNYRVNGTFINSFLFNVELMLLTSLTIVQFCAFAFSQYARITALGAIYNVGITNLRGLKFLFRWYWVAWLFIAGLSFLYFAIFPAVRKKKKSEVFLDELDLE